jgi:uncharacterized protein (DUF1778 family)
MEGHPAMDEQMTKSERLNLRVSEDALTTIREAAALQGQDMTSFVMGAALERARAVLAEDQLLRLSPQAVLQLERALDHEPAAIPQLTALFKKYGTDRQKGVDKREHVTN